jgi:hypothetical protein
MSFVGSASVLSGLKIPIMQIEGFRMRKVPSAVKGAEYLEMWGCGVVEYLRRL